jgi:hypothetical protein
MSNPPYITIHVNAIREQAAIHREIAAFYDQARQQIDAHGQSLIGQLRDWLPDDAYTYQNQWLQPTLEDILDKERDAHLRCADWLEIYADEVETTENVIRTGVC